MTHRGPHFPPDDSDAGLGGLGQIVELSRGIAGESNPVHALWLLVCALRRELRVDRAGVFSFDSRTRALDRIVGVDRHGKPEYSGETIAVTDAVHPLMLVANQKIPFLISNHVASEFPGVKFDCQALAIVPIVASGSLLGVLCVDNYLSGRPFAEALVDPLHLYAGLAALPLFAIYQRQERERADGLRRIIYRDVFLAATSGKIRLCTAEELEAEWPHPTDPIHIDTEKDVGMAREKVRSCAAQAGLDAERSWDLVVCASEAATNALLHGSGGVAHVESTGEVVRVRVQDGGSGIALEHLPNATLRAGWSGGRMPSMGHGFVLMYKLADRVLLHTGPLGTALILEMNLAAEDPLPARWNELD